MELKTKQQIAEAYFIYKQLEKALKGKDLPPGVYSLDNRQITFTIHPGSTITRAPGENGDGIMKRTATPKLYGYAILHALTYHLYRFLAKFNQNAKAEEQAIRLVRNIVNSALKSGISSEQAFREKHPQLAQGIEETKQKVRKRLGKLEYPTPRMVKGDLAMKSKAA